MILIMKRMLPDFILHHLDERRKMGCNSSLDDCKVLHTLSFLRLCDENFILAVLESPFCATCKKQLRQINMCSTVIVVGRFIIHNVS